ncbi:MAG: hypothetical protein FWF41_04735 [Betaproteobacteria bacterium]|nr:hypothetical protein [Betaproteobacteria bacterium]
MMSLRTLSIIGGALALLLLITLGLELDWGRRMRQQKPEPTATIKPLEIALLPEIKANPLEARKETVNRPLFTPTRQPAPPSDATAGANKVDRGLYILSGTAIQGQTRIAFLRNAKDNKPTTVRVGDMVDGMKVSVVTADKVVLTAGGQEEELQLKVATGPKGAITPTTLPGQTPQPGQRPGQPPQPGQPVVRQGQPVPQPAPVGQRPLRVGG